MTVINLIELGEQLALTGKPIHNKINETGKPFNVLANLLAAKKPELAKLKEIALFRIYKLKSGDFEAKTLALYLDDSGKPVVFAADLKPLPGKVEYLSYKTGLNGFQRIKYEGVELVVETSLNDEYRENLVTWGSVEGEGLPDIKFLADLPHPTVPLKDLPLDVVFQVLKSTGTDKKYNSTRHLIKNTKTGEEFEVFENSQMREMIVEHGFPCEFQIGSVTKKQGKKGESDTHFVRLIDLKKPTFEDIAI